MAQVISPEIIYEDSDIIVCRKPAGLPTQSARIRTPDMVSLLKTRLASGSKKLSSSRGEPYLAVIHRLDQPVEGLLVFAKTPAAAKNLNQQLPPPVSENTTVPLSPAYRNLPRACWKTI